MCDELFPILLAEPDRRGVTYLLSKKLLEDAGSKLSRALDPTINIK
jgi:hypothetical protein